MTTEEFNTVNEANKNHYIKIKPSGQDGVFNITTAKGEVMCKCFDLHMAKVVAQGLDISWCLGLAREKFGDAVFTLIAPFMYEEK